ncbi:MAG TPA: phosphatase PAP2 family protein [Opitutaceae bacterium]
MNEAGTAVVPPTGEVPPAPLERSFWPVVALLAAVMVLFEWSDVDLALQDRFFDFATQRWLVDGRAPVPRWWFYTAPKIVLAVSGAGLLVIALGAASWRRWCRGSSGSGRRELLVVVATLASGPALIGIGKAVTNVFCPSEIRRYGGDVAYVPLCGTFPEGDRPARRGRCFPAGHASGGFALLSLAGLARTRRGQAWGVAAGLAAGWTMGLYQMFKGAHYLSHTLVTMLVVWLVFLAWRRIFGLAGPRVRRERGTSAG